MAVQLPNLGSGRTTCQVLICRHDRSKHTEKDGKDSFEGNISDTLDISSYVNAVAIATNISGGGSGTLSLIPAFPWEDELAANDIINIYLNTNRGDESSTYKEKDMTPKYNRGNVRVFFGYIDQISKSVSIGGTGTRVTTYTMSYTSFEKAIKATEIYSNPNLAFQGDATDTIRPDISNNLGGLILLQKGFPIAGSPRHLIIAHLFRTLGFGGQWILPQSYEENLGKYDLTEGNSDFRPWQLTWSRKERDKEEAHKTGRLISFYAPDLKQVSDPKSKGIIAYNTSFKYYPKDLDGKGLESKAKEDFMTALQLVGSEARISSISDLDGLKAKFREFITNQNPGSPLLSYIFDNILGNLYATDGTLYVTTVNTAEFTFARQILETWGDFTWEMGTAAEKGGLRALQATANKRNAFWEHLFLEQAPQVTPLVNHTTNPKGAVTPAKTLFNILCLDYMEDVDGNYIMSEMYNFGGPLHSQLQRQSNALISELFFDLRVAPNFKRTATDKDGLGVELDGAIPMVAAVVLREKPFTNYTIREGEGEFDKADKRDKIAIGRFSDADATGTYSADQYFLKTQGLRSYTYLIGNDQAYAKLKGTLKPIDGVAFTTNTVKQGDTLNRKNGKYKNGKLTPIDKGQKEVFAFQATVAGEGDVPLAAQPYKLEFSLPRAVFRSPDDHRVTRESKIASMEAILGYMKKGDGGKVSFVAFGTNVKSKGTILNSTKQQTWAEKGGFSTIDVGHEYVYTSPFSGGNSGTGTVDAKDQPTTWHILDYMTIRNEDVVSESYTRGDIQISNIRELNMAIMPDFEVQRATIRDILPIINPVSIYRNGIRVALNNSTSFIQYMLVGGSSDHSWHQALGFRWAIMLDMWEQHNHEYLMGTIAMRGMPGLRIGYRIDRKELGLSFYVQSVSHSWEYPGAMMTQISVGRGQPLEEDRVLKYYEPEPMTNSNEQQRMELGRLFRSSQVTTDEQLGAGTLINLKNKISDLRVKS